MKKALSILCAVALAFSLSMPAFAAATPGQGGEPTPVPTPVPTETPDNSWDQEISDALNQGNTAAAADALTNLVTEISSKGEVVVTSNTAGLISKVMDAAGTSKAVTNSSSVPAGVTASAVADSTASDVTLNSVEVSAKDAAHVTIKLDASMSTQSPLGVRMTLSLPASLFNGVDLQNSSLHLLYQTSSGATQTLFTLLSREQTADTVTLTFWVPHFSTYYITTSTDIAGGNNGGDNGGNNGGNNGSSNTTPAAPTTAPAANPIKATGADMNAAVVFLAVGAAVALACGVVVVKKSGLNI